MRPVNLEDTIGKIFLSVKKKVMVVGDRQHF